MTVTDERGSDDGIGPLAGKYVRVGCTHTLNQSACWRRNQTGNTPELYILMKPTVARTGADVGIISTSTNHNDSASIVATFPWKWQPCDALNETKHTVSNVTLSHWTPIVEKMSCFSLTTTFTVEAPSTDDSSVLISMRGLSERDVANLCRDESGSESIVHLDVHRGAKAQQNVRSFNLMCVAPFLKHAAAHGLKYDIKLNAPWKRIEAKDVEFGCCKTTLPCRPSENWIFDDARKQWQRTSEPGASRRFVLDLQKAPQCFDFVVDKAAKTFTVHCFPEVAAHHAALGLIEGRGAGLERELKVDFRLLSVQEDPVLERFRLHNCQELPETNVTLRKSFELYERQKKAVTKMLSIERGETEFEEIEMNEQSMPGGTGWSLIARASRVSKLRGGVIADGELECICLYFSCI
jgi:hypothetical protein